MTTSNRRSDCGCRPQDSHLACDLVRRGVDCRLIERGDGSFPGSVARASAATREIFDDLGSLDEIHDAGGPFPLIRRWRVRSQLGHGRRH